MNALYAPFRSPDATVPMKRTSQHYDGALRFLGAAYQVLIA
jgi:hypothetical protein